MFVELLQTAARHHQSRGLTGYLRHMGAFGLFFLAVLDSSPLPTFGGTDILTAILAATHRNLWYEYAAVATAGSIIGAYTTFRLARKAGMSYLQGKFGHGKLTSMLNVFDKWGTGALAVSAAVPFPFPTSMFFAAAGASGYKTRKYITVVTLSRAVRYTLIAMLAEHYGRGFIRVIRHPGQYWGWLLILGALVAALAATVLLMNKKLTAPAPQNGVEESVPGDERQFAD